MVAGTLPVVETTQSVGRCCNLRPGGKYVDNRGMDHHEHADDLLRRALLDKEASAAVALRVTGLPLCEELTVVFHGRRDLGTIQTYVTNGGRGAGSAVGPDELLRVPCDLDLPAALRAPERQIVVTAVCGARPLAEGRPPMGIVCVQQDVARVYPLPDDPERCLEDFLDIASEHAKRMAEQLTHQEASVQRFLELSGDDFMEAG